MKLNDAINWKQADRLFVSLAARPGKTGETFYNTLFKHHNINAEYVACECTDLDLDMAAARGKCAGISVSMPYKTQLTPYIDVWQCTQGVANTVILDQGRFIAYNCDYLGLVDAVQPRLLGKTVTLLGDGAMAKNILELCQGIATVTQYSRRLGNWDLRHQNSDVLINATSIGMNPDESPVDHVLADLVIDCVIGNTELTKSSTNIVSGAEIYIAQFKHQFKLYTGQEPDLDVVKLVAKKVFEV